MTYDIGIVLRPRTLQQTNVYFGGARIAVDPSTLAWVNQVAINGGSVSNARQLVVDTFIITLKAKNVWTKCDRLSLLAAENTPSALTDLVSLTLSVAQGSPTFTTDRGYTGIDASSTVYLDTGFNPTVGTPQFAQNAGHLSAWSNTAAASSANGGAIIGLRDSTGVAQNSLVISRY